jgi:hypothetical protein
MCGNILDEKLKGDKDRAHLYLRFNSLDKQELKDNSIVRYVVHNGSCLFLYFIFDLTK